MQSTTKTRPTRGTIPVAAIALLPALAFTLVVSPPATSSADGTVVLRLQDMNGVVYDAGAMLDAGHPVVLVFWQTWCPSCKREAPELAEAVERYDDRIQFFGVVSGPDKDVDDDDVTRTARKWGHPQPQIRDRDLALAKRFGVSGTPVIVVLGTQGRVLYRGTRLPGEWSAFLPAVPEAGTTS